MVSLISLAALIEPHDLKAAVDSAQGLEAMDLQKLTDLYLRAHGAGTPESEKAASRIGAVFEGVHGRPIPEASLLATDAEGHVTAAIVTIERTLGSDGARTAFIAELFTHPDLRRQGLAEELLNRAMQALHAKGHRTVAVTVDSANAAAIALYLSRGFRRLTQPEQNV